MERILVAARPLTLLLLSRRLLLLQAAPVLADGGVPAALGAEDTFQYFAGRPATARQLRHPVCLPRDFLGRIRDHHAEADLSQRGDVVDIVRDERRLLPREVMPAHQLF